MSWLGQSISWLLIICGWVIVNRQNNERETRKEVRASLLDLYKHLDDIEDAALDYHTTDGAPSKARRIRRDIQQVAPRIMMARRGPMRINYSRAVFEFRQTITFDNFDTATFKPKAPQDPFFDEITRAKRELILLLERAYGAAYN